eukprot:Gb_24815 [translate_table: standard]
MALNTAKLKNNAILYVGRLHQQLQCRLMSTTCARKTEGSIGPSSVTTLCKQGRLTEALQILHVMDNYVDAFTYARLLQVLVNKKALSEGKLVHAHIIQTGFKCQDIFLGNTLVNMYAKCGNLVDALRVLDRMPERDVVSWTVLIAAYARHDHCEEALTLSYQMKLTGIQPNQFTFASILRVCANCEALQYGEKIHQEIIVSGFESDVFVGSTLVDLYAKCGRIEHARHNFDKIPQRDVVSWNAMIAGYAQNAHTDEALTLLCQMRREGIQPDQFTFASVLPACGNLVVLQEVHEDIIRSGYNSDIFVGCAILDMYAQCESIENARHVFDEMPQRDVVLWNAMVAGYAQNGHVDEALTLFYQMQQTGIQPNQFTFATVIPAFANLATLEKAHEEIIRRGLESNIFVGNALVDMYAKCGSIENARHLFDKMPQRNVISWTSMISGYAQNGLVNEALKLFQKMPERNVVSWNAMVAGYAQHGYAGEALKLFQKMPQQNVMSWNALITGYAQNGHVSEALKLFQKMPERNVVSWNAMITGYAQNGHVDEALKLFQKMPERNVVSWTAMIAGYAQNGHAEEALKLFREMQLAGIKPDSGTFVIVLPACAYLAAMNEGKEIHEVIIKSGFQSNVFVGSALVDMYVKCGSIENARNVFDKVNQQDLVLWNAMIVGYAMHGCGKEALQFFEQMQHCGMNPDQVTFVGVLSACCHSGLVDEGSQYFSSMSEYYHITPTIKHYGCMVDLLGRAGRLDEAQDFINKMPVKPDAALWGCLLSACRIHTNIELGERVAERFFELDPQNPTPYVLLSNIYAAASRWDGIERVRNMMKDKRVKKNPGCSWIVINKKAYAFFVGEKLHPQAQKIYGKLERLSM